jgi:hypothetical protein
MSDTCTEIQECCDPSPFSLYSQSSPASTTGCGAAECCPPEVFDFIPTTPPIGNPTCELMDGFGLWLDGAPIPCESGDEGFLLWNEGEPLVEKSDTY